MNKKGFNLQELTWMIVILAVISVAAIVRFVNVPAKSFKAQELALINSLKKAMIAYNVQYEVWPGAESNFDLFARLLGSPPPYIIGSICNEYGGCVADGRNWRLEYNAGPPVQWYIQCPHNALHMFPANPGYFWTYSTDSGTISLQTIFCTGH